MVICGICGKYGNGNADLCDLCEIVGKCIGGGLIIITNNTNTNTNTTTDITLTTICRAPDNSGYYGGIECGFGEYVGAESIILTIRTKY